MKNQQVMDTQPNVSARSQASLHVLPETGFLRLWQIIGDKKNNLPALIPVSRTTFLNGVKSGKYPKPINLGSRTVAWKVEDIKLFINSLGGLV
ncbi:MAG: AlpA family phage regulatory protein [Methylococcales bacterium]|nr:AlpA family phage regulatory protein [Methylococcales bacterium]